MHAAHMGITDVRVNVVNFSSHCKTHCKTISSQRYGLQIKLSGGKKREMSKMVSFRQRLLISNCFEPTIHQLHTQTSLQELPSCGFYLGRGSVVTVHCAQMNPRALNNPPTPLQDTLALGDTLPLFEHDGR